MITFDGNQVEVALKYEMLIERLRSGFQKELGIPKRHHHNYPNPPGKEESTLLLMPAWEEGKNLGVKIVNVTPQNGKINLPSIHGIYLFFDGKTGVPAALMDSNMITKKRTAATSALASQFLSKEDSSSLFMIGTGALAPELIRAHCTVRDISKIYIWGRDLSKADKLAEQFDGQRGLEVHTVSDVESGVKNADIISVATLSKEPLIKGKWLSEGQHVDLVGSYKPDMREADDMVLQRSSIFIDSYEGAPNESGDLAIPLNNQVISLENINADLFELCRQTKTGRKSDQEITVFKSVGHALEDLVAAQLVYEMYQKDETNE